MTKLDNEILFIVTRQGFQFVFFMRGYICAYRQRDIWLEKQISSLSHNHDKVSQYFVGQVWLQEKYFMFFTLQGLGS